MSALKLSKSVAGQNLSISGNAFFGDACVTEAIISANSEAANNRHTEPQLVFDDDYNHARLLLWRIIRSLGLARQATTLRSLFAGNIPAAEFT